MKNRGKVGRFYILSMFKNILKIKVMPQYFRFYRCSKNEGYEGKPG